MEISLVEYLFEKVVLGLVPKQLGPGEDITIFDDGHLGSKGAVGDMKPNPNNPNRHFSVKRLTRTKTKMTGDTLTTLSGVPISKVRQNNDIKRSPKSDKYGD